MANDVKDGRGQPLEQGGATEGHRVDAFAVNRLDVPMRSSLAVRRIQSFRNLNCYIKQAFEAYRLLTDRMLKRHAIQMLHRDEGSAIFFTHVVNGVRMI